MIFGAFSDVHGNLQSLAELLESEAIRGVDFLVFAGDMTNAEYDGYEKGLSQMRQMSAMIRSSGLDLIYVLGNRDSAGGRLLNCPLSGDLAQGDIHRGEFRFTARADNTDAQSVYVCHSLDPSFRVRQLPARLVMYGHNHVHRVYRNYVGLGYMKDGDEAGEPRGGFFTIELPGGTGGIRFHSLGGMVESRCPVHADQGRFFIPSIWEETCPMCRNDPKYRFHF